MSSSVASLPLTSSPNEESDSLLMGVPGSRSDGRKRAQHQFRIRLVLRHLFPLIASLFCAAMFGLCVWALIEGRLPLLRGYSYVGVFVAMIFLFTAAVKLLNGFLNAVTAVSEDESSAAMICSAEVTIDSETVLTVRSWWPLSMSQEDVRKHGKRVAITSARRWLADNRQSETCSKIRFSDDAALALCRSHVTTPVSAVSPCSLADGACSVCLEELGCCKDDNCVKMRHCGHLFHDSCLATWFVQSSRLQCPMCRADHKECIPAVDLEAHTVTEERVITVISIAVEEGVLATNP